MKTYISLFISAIILVFGTQTFAQEKNFEFSIHETLSLNDIRPLTENQSKSVLKQDLKLDEPIVAFLNIDDKDYKRKLITDHSSPRAFILPLKHFGGNYSLAIVSLKKEAALSIEDIAKAVPSANGIELRLSYKGARKFAKLTKDNVGKMIAFVINGEIWSMPRVNAPITGGVALIGGIRNKEIIEKTCKLINSNLRP